MSKLPDSLFVRAARLALGALLLAAPVLARAQSGIGDVVYTVGTVVHDSHGQDWAFLLWQATQTGLVSNRVFAIYSKPGDPTNNVPYSRLSLVSLQTDARVIEPLLRRAENLGDDTAKLQQDLQQLFTTLMPSGSITRADQLSAVIRGSLNNPDYYQNLLLLARNHAGIDLALGFADAELIPAGRTTFEIRAYDPTANQDLAVIGRVTVEAGNPTVLPAPGPPVLMPVNSARGDLNLLFRWGTPDNLRRLGLMQSGYDLFRVSQAYAAANGWNATNAPSATNLLASSSAQAKRVNRVPVTPDVLFNLAAAANLTPPGNTNTSFVMDDDGRGKTNYVNYGFTNGAQFYYYVAARDVLGRDGALSPGLLATVCDRMPPLPPTSVHVLNDYTFDPGTLTSNQVLRINWKQNPNTNDTVTNYWIYRWTNIAQMNQLSGDPSNNLIAVVAHVPGAAYNNFKDAGPTSPSALHAYGETYWYTVRAGDAGACGQNLSGPGGPAFGVLRQRNGPAAGTGAIEINCTQPQVSFLGANLRALPKNPDTTNYDIFLEVPRLDSRFEWVELYGIAQSTATSGGPPVVVSNFIGRFYYQGASSVSTWWTPPRANAQFRVTMQVGCRAELSNGKASSFISENITPPDFAFYNDVKFMAIAQGVRVIAGTNNPDCQQHDPGGGLGGLPGTNNIIVYSQPSAGSREFRVYRRVDSGPLTLLAQGPITNFSLTITNYENSPPLNGGTICFYEQFLDESGNPSPLTPIGCVDSAPTAAPPVPVLARIQPTGDQNSAGMTLSWFCAPYGVERLEVRIAGAPTPPDTNNLSLSAVLGNMGAAPNPMTFTNQGAVLTLPFYTFITPRVGPGFGNNGADFTVPCNIELGKTYYVTVRALVKDGYPGDFSGTESFLWTPTNTPSSQVQWPARGLPGTNANFPALAASFISPAGSGSVVPSQASGVYSGNGVYIGSLAFSPSVSVTLATGPAYITSIFNPNSAVFTNTTGDSLFPCALYRYQVPNARFPTVSGDVIQVSPLMETIAYGYDQGGGGSTGTNAPVIINQPQSQTNAIGATVAFSVCATGSAPLSYQWEFNGKPIAGATLTSLTLTNVQTNNAGVYSVAVANFAGQALSSGATLTLFAGSLLPQGAGTSFFNPPCTNAPPSTVIYDPFVAATTGADGSHRYIYLWLEDTQPQISGASYQYILVRFKPNHEIDQLIPSSNATVP